MVNRRPADEGDRAIWRAIRDGLASGVDAGLADGLADGLRRHLPGGVAIVVKGTPLCMLFAFVHLVLGVPVPATAIAALLAAAGVGGIPPLLRVLRPTESETQALNASAPDEPVGHPSLDPASGIVQQGRAPDTSRNAPAI